MNAVLTPEQAAFFADTFARLTDNIGQALPIGR